MSELEWDEVQGDSGWLRTIVGSDSWEIMERRAICPQCPWMLSVNRIAQGYFPSPEAAMRTAELYIEDQVTA